MRAGYAWLLVIACGRAPPIDAPSRNTAPGEALPEIGAVLDICTGIDDHDANTRWVSANWPARKYAGDQFELLGRAGPVATVRITSREIDCDDCPGPSAVADIIEHTGKPTDGCYPAIGPLVRPLQHAVRIDVPGTLPISAHAVTEWTPTERYDLDGNGTPDIARVMRCARVVPSGCNDHVCDRVCEGVRHNGDVRGEHCESFMPDIDDCGP